MKDLNGFLDRIHESFGRFMEALWLDRGLNRYAPLGWVEYDICDWIQSGPVRCGVLAWRGFGKTHLVTAGVTCWDLYRDPNAKVLIVSKSELEAKKTVKLIRDWIEHVPFLQHLAPSGGLRDSATQFDVTGSNQSRDPSVSAKGIDGQITGTRASRVLGDDVETKTNTKTVEARTDLDEKVKEFSAIASYGERRINYIGTFHHEESLYLKLQARGYQFRTWPILYPQPNDKILNLAPKVQERIAAGRAEPGQIVADYRVSREYVIEQQSEGLSWFAMQMMLLCDLGDLGRYPLKLSDFIVFPVHRDQAPIAIAWGKNNGQGDSTRQQDIPSLGFGSDGFYGPIMYDKQWGPYTGTKMWIDPSGRGQDKTGYAIVAYAAGHLWCKACGGLTGGFDPPTLSALAQLARTHGATEIAIEDNFGQGMFEPLFLPVLQRHFVEKGEDESLLGGWKASTSTVRVHGQKEIRILEALEPVLSSHRLVIDRTVASNESLQRQITRLTRQRNCLDHDDEVESLAMAVMQWQHVLRVDPEKVAERQRDALIEQGLAEMRAMAGIRPRPPRWFTHA